MSVALELAVGPCLGQWIREHVGTLGAEQDSTDGAVRKSSIGSGNGAQGFLHDHLLLLVQGSRWKLAICGLGASARRSSRGLGQGGQAREGLSRDTGLSGAQVAGSAALGSDGHVLAEVIEDLPVATGGLVRVAHHGADLAALAGRPCFVALRGDFVSTTLDKELVDSRVRIGEQEHAVGLLAVSSGAPSLLVVGLY